MAYPAKKSPLLNLRPDFLGAGRGVGRINITFELSFLSGLFHNFTNSAAHLNTDVNETELLDTTPSCSAINTSLNNGKLSNKNDEYMVKSQENRTIYKVFERNKDGLFQKHVPYTLNPKTVELFSIFENLNIPFKTEIYKHKEDRLLVDPMLFYCKNLFLKDRKGQFFLVICHEDHDIDLKQLRKDLKANRNFNFGTANDMKELLNTEPGGVTPLALMNKTAANVSMVISNSLVKEGASLMFHPMDSNLATQISLASLLRFHKFVQHPVIFLK